MQDALKDKLAPCGLLCEKCYAFSKGSIKLHAQQLMDSLGNFDPYAKRFVSLLNEPIFEKYPDFQDFLQLLITSSCEGCRKQECHLFSGCKVRICYKDKGVDFCFQCNEFPCQNTGFDHNLEQRWLKINQRIREIGIDNYYIEIKDKPRY